MGRMNPNDYANALVPAILGVTIAEVNQLLGCVSLVLGMAYLTWKWRQEARKGRK